jgi:hypothetical protein
MNDLNEDETAVITEYVLKIEHVSMFKIWIYRDNIWIKKWYKYISFIERLTFDLY